MLSLYLFALFEEHGRPPRCWLLVAAAGRTASAEEGATPSRSKDQLGECACRRTHLVNPGGGAGTAIPPGGRCRRGCPYVAAVVGGGTAAAAATAATSCGATVGANVQPPAASRCVSAARR